MKKLTSKQIGDAGEHFVAGKIGMKGLPVVVMPDNWPDYDLLVAKNNQKITVQVKTFADLFGSGWNPAFSPELAFDFLAIVDAQGDSECWLIPANMVEAYLQQPRPEAKNQKPYLPKKHLNGDLAQYRDNWTLAQFGGAS